jgi:4-hydroxy-tetrahydrodipicolinate synthase
VTGAAPFTGVGVALATIFDENGELDVPASAELAVRLVDLGVRAVVVSGSTGEAAALSAEERVLLLVGIREAVPDHIPVIAGTGGPSARQAAALILVLSPPGVTDVRPYYDVVAAAAGDLPVLAYHYPKVSPPGIPVEDLGELPVAGLKDSTGDATRLLEELCWGRPLYTGSAVLLALAGPVGCTGAILALANIAPEDCIAAFAGDPDAQRRLLPAHRQAQGAFPRGLKEQIARRFGLSPVSRLG